MPDIQLDSSSAVVCLKVLKQFSRRRDFPRYSEFCTHNIKIVGFHIKDMAIKDVVDGYQLSINEFKSELVLFKSTDR